MRRTSGLFDVLCDLCAVAAGVIVLAIMMAVSADVLLRFFFASPLSWVLQFTEYGLLYVVFLGAPWLQQERGHVAVDLLTSRLSPRYSQLFARLASLVGAVTFAIIAWYGFVLTSEQFLTGSVTADLIAVPRYLITMVIPFGSALLSISFLKQI